MRSGRVVALVLVVLAAWFDQFLKGKNTGVLDGPRVQIETDQHVWRHEESFPPRHTSSPRPRRLRRLSLSQQIPSSSMGARR